MKPSPLPSASQRVLERYHVPVLLEETLAALLPSPDKWILDGTLGGGGHAQAILRRGGKIIGLDQDGGAIGYCIQHLVVYDGDTVRIKQANFRNLGPVLHQLNLSKVDGILLDLGVSSAQIDRPERGFSFQRPGPLDMRMDQTQAGLDAAEIVNGASVEELVRIFRTYGEEPAASRIAAAIVSRRQTARIVDTLDLAAVVENVVPKHGPRHPATRVFQALRIAVNDELGALTQALNVVGRHLHAGGRLAIITFQSLEDRIVKRFFREVTATTIDRPEWPAPRRNPSYAFRAVTKRAVQATEDEVRRNPRARSAKLRVLERLA